MSLLVITQKESGCIKLKIRLMIMVTKILRLKCVDTTVSAPTNESMKSVPASIHAPSDLTSLELVLLFLNAGYFGHPVSKRRIAALKRCVVRVETALLVLKREQGVIDDLLANDRGS